MRQGIVAIGGKSWLVDITETSSEMAQGLSGISSIPAGTGMLFPVFNNVVITMENMLFPLDIASITSGAVARIDRDVAPGTNTCGQVQHIYPGYVDYFLEVNVGELDGVTVGNVVVITDDGANSAPSFGTAMMDVMVLGMVGMMMNNMTGIMTQSSTVYTDTKEAIDGSMVRCQTEMDDAFVKAINRAKAMYGLMQTLRS